MPQTENIDKKDKNFFFSFIEEFLQVDDTRREYEKLIDKKESILCAL